MSRCVYSLFLRFFLLTCLFEEYIDLKLPCLHIGVFPNGLAMRNLLRKVALPCLLVLFASTASRSQSLGVGVTTSDPTNGNA